MASTSDHQSPAICVESPTNSTYHAKKDHIALDTKPDQSVESCSILFMFILCAPKMAMNMAWAAQWAALGPLLETLLSPSAVQAVQLVGPTTGLLIAPTIGVLSDACTSRWGRRRPFLFWGAVTSALCWGVMMNATAIGAALGDGGGDRTWTTVVVVMCYIWMDITVNITQVPAGLIIADFAGHRQVTAASIGAGYSIAGSFAVSGYILVFGPAHQSIHLFLGMLIGIMLTTTLSVCWFVHETPLIESDDSIIVRPPKYHKIRSSLQAVWTGFRKLPKTLAVYCAIMLLVQYGFTAYNGAKGQFFGLVVYRGVAKDADTCGKPNTLPCTPRQIAFNDGVRLAGGLTDTIFNAVGLVFLAALPFLVRKVGAKWVITASIIPQAMLVVMVFCHVVPVDVMLVVGCTVTQNTIFALVMPMIIHVVGHSSDNNLGLFAGAFNSANCCGQFLNFIFSAILVKSAMGHALPILVGGILSTGAFLVALFALKVDLRSM
ncbi:hypothetical protein DYB37_009727 [Aphanomyces astaci]|uniref:Major facilitator superfamily (MFS) profile domain-containing protein n=1 Tax=Aphanomyces astaci TaxID=112090 RepID=A0A3R7BIN9_APHAT|nr:hypothetical protein DYB35_003726 [Aphanomyces astaci]RHZ13519.1 hypothetical protein DYB37_009727 [Aphanomyces astaci]